MTLRQVQIVNARGLHARPCHALVSAALEFECELRVRCGDVDVNGKSILELMMLNAACGVEIELEAQGRDAEVLLDRLVELISTGFGESS